MQPARSTEQYPLRFLTLDQPPIPPPRDLTSPTFPTPPQTTRTDSSTAPHLPAAQTRPLTTPKPPEAHAQIHPAASAAEGKPAQAATPELQTKQPALQTLLQPDLQPEVLPKIPLLPEAVIWTPERPVVKVLTPSLLKQAASANVRPAPWRPNTADLVADVKIAPNTVTVNLPLPSPSTTTPIALPEQSPVNQILETAAKEAVSPTPARIAFLAKLQLEQGTVALPEINEIAPGSPNSLTGDGPTYSKGAGGAVPAQESGVASSGTGRGARPSTPEAGGAGIAGNVKGDLSEVAQGSVPGFPGTASEPSAAPGTSDNSPSPNTTLIRHPKDGQFNFVVVGSSVAEKYPDAPNPWGGRLAYSVYLHVGSRKNWILQYSLPKNARMAAGAMTSQPEAPWPYLIVRPHLPPADWNSDAIIVHGFVDPDGHFQKLAVVFPPEFSDANFVVHSLNQWAFRPAMENGHTIAVEVLVIIPDQDE